MTDETLNRMHSASYLLPDPGGEVVRDLIQRIRAIEAENAALKPVFDLSFYLHDCRRRNDE